MLSFELLHVVPHAIVQATNCSKSQKFKRQYFKVISIYILSNFIIRAEIVYRMFSPGPQVYNVPTQMLELTQGTSINHNLNFWNKV